MTYNEPQRKHSLASLRRWQRMRMEYQRSIWWQTKAPNRYTQLEINSAPFPPKELLLSLKLLWRPIAFRAAHRDFAAYYTRFHHHDVNLYCKCGSPKTTLHFFFCRILRRRNGRPPEPTSSLITSLLGAPKGADMLFEWLEKANFFANICNR